MSEEILQRVRRIETRVTEVAIALGVGTGAQKPSFCHATTSNPWVSLPSPHASAASILEAIPENILGEVDVFLGESRLFTLRR